MRTKALTMSDALPPDLDSILATMNAQPATSDSGGGGNMMIQMMMLQMERDRSDRAASRQTMLQLVTALAPLILPMLLGKKEADPVLMTVLSGLMAKNNDGEQLKSFMQMMAAASQMSMDQMKTSLLSIMEIKDAQTKKMLDEAHQRGGDDDGPASGPAAIMREIRLGLGSLVAVAGPAQPTTEAPAALPAPAAGAGAGAPAAANPGQPKRPQAPPVVVLLHQLRAIQTGAVKATPATWAALATVALQDPALIQACDDCSEDDLQPLLAYCAPHVQQDTKVLLPWITTPGVAQWVDKVVRSKLLPMIDAARDDDQGDEDQTDGDEPETLDVNAADAAGVTNG